MKTINLENAIEEAKKNHNNKYDYSKIVYKNWKSKVCIICPEHGEFWQTLYNHKNGEGCPICGKISASLKLSDTTEKFIEKAKEIHGNRYDYSKVEYVNNRTKVCIICPEHGEFWQTPANHLKGSNCPKCVENQSKLEKEIRKMLEKENIYYIFQYKTDWLKHKKLMSIDFYLPDYNIAIECQGEQHFKPIFYFGGEKEFKNVQKRDKLKNLLCKKNNVKILYYSNKKYNDNIITDKKELLNSIKNV